MTEKVWRVRRMVGLRDGGYHPFGDRCISHARLQHARVLKAYSWGGGRRLASPPGYAPTGLWPEEAMRVTGGHEDSRRSTVVGIRPAVRRAGWSSSSDAQRGMDRWASCITRSIARRKIHALSEASFSACPSASARRSRSAEPFPTASGAKSMIAESVTS
jgi:hypothetical protein